MSVANSNVHERKVTLPFVLLMLCLLALLVSLLGLARTASVANERLDQLQESWAAVQDGTVEGSELVANDRLMERMRRPVPAVRSAAFWSLGLALVSVALLAWLLTVARRVAIASHAAEDGREQREQAAVLKLIDEMAPLASGDLRVKATVTESATGGLADAFNYAVSELRWLVGTLGHAAHQVIESVERSRHSAETVAAACSEQSSEIHKSSNYLLNMSGTMAELSGDAADLSVAAQAAVEQAERGVDALSASLNRLSTIRDEADTTTRLMHRLADNVAAIDDRVSDIQEVAKRTDLLALNTTIRASAGSRSATVTDAAADLGRLSDEVAQLAEVLGQATRDIGSLTSTISQDASNTVQSMEHTTAELVAGVDQTQLASDALDAIRQNSLALRQRVVAMADKTVEQSGVVRQLSENMDVINRITRQTANGVTGNADSLDELTELASELRQSVSDFRLPAKNVDEGRKAASTVTSSQARKAADRAVLHE